MTLFDTIYDFLHIQQNKEEENGQNARCFNPGNHQTGAGKENNLTKIKVRENETIKKKIEKLLDDLSEKELRLVLVFLYNL